MFGHGVRMVIAEDIRGPWLGCCVDQGVTLALDKGGDYPALADFARNAGCSLGEAATDTRLAILAEEGVLKNSDVLLALSYHENDFIDNRDGETEDGL